MVTTKGFFIRYIIILYPTISKSQVGEIGTNIERLRQALRDSEDNLKGLNRQQLTLEEDIEIKTNTLFIDQDQNMVLRQQIQHKKY